MRRFSVVLGGLFLVIALSAAVSTASHQQAAGAAASPQVALDWNATAVATTIAAGKSQPESGLYVGLTQAAVYDAVIAVDGGFHPYLIVPGVPPGSSDEAAAAAAAYGVLLGYFPAQKPALDAAYATSLAGIPDGTAKDRGVLVGQQVAAGLLAARIDDGRDAAVPFAPTPGLGVWQPTPPAYLPALTPWLGVMKPLLLDSASQFRPGPPPALDSRQYARDYNETRLYGALNGSLRTSQQTETALFYTENAAQQYNRALRGFVSSRQTESEGRGPGARNGRHDNGRRADCVLGRKRHLRLLAAGDGNRGRQHGRQRPHDGRPELAAASAYAEPSGVSVGAQLPGGSAHRVAFEDRRQRRDQPGRLEHRDRNDPPLPERRRLQARHHRCPRLRGLPLPHLRRSRLQAGHRRSPLGAAPLLREKLKSKADAEARRTSSGPPRRHHACENHPTPGARPMTATSSTIELDPAAVDELERSFRGHVLRPVDPSYDEQRRVWNGSVNRFPALIARCAGVADVRAAVRFARQAGLPVAVRSGGHSFPGLSVCDDGIVIDLGSMKGIRVDPEARTARVQAGALLGELDRETQEFGLAVPAGIVSHTGVAGLTLGGGIGWLMRKHGLTIDQLLAVDLVTADGQFVKASETENAELFWGLRGGGGELRDRHRVRVPPEPGRPDRPRRPDLLADGRAHRTFCASTETGSPTHQTN